LKENNNQYYYHWGKVNSYTAHWDELADSIQNGFCDIVKNLNDLIVGVWVDPRQ